MNIKGKNIQYDVGDPTTSFVEGGVMVTLHWLRHAEDTDSPCIRLNRVDANNEVLSEPLTLTVAEIETACDLLRQAEGSANLSSLRRSRVAQMLELNFGE